MDLTDASYSLANGFAYWQGQTIDDSYSTYFDDISQAISHIQKVAGNDADSIRVLNGETGWPSGKTKLGKLRYSPLF